MIEPTDVLLTGVIALELAQLTWFSTFQRRLTRVETYVADMREEQRRR